MVVVSFVLYLSQGSSVFDLMSDGGREKKEFYGYDWNNPDQRRFLNVTSRAAGAVGVLVSPTQEVVEAADNSYMQGLQQQIQAAFRANPDKVDQEALQQMFQYMQAWSNFPRDFKVREIARSGAYDGEFLDQSIKSRVALAGQADAWSFLPLNVNDPAINTEFINFLSSIDPSLRSEDNRTAALSMYGARFGMTGSELESVLYSCFRGLLVDRIYTHRGYALPDEVNVLSHQNSFARDGEVAVVYKETLPETKVVWGEIIFSGIPKAGEQVEFIYGPKQLTFEFGNPTDDKNGTLIGIPLASNPGQIAKQLSNVINESDFGLVASTQGKSGIQLILKDKLFPKSSPKFSTTSKVISLDDQLLPSIAEFHQQNNDLGAFLEDRRTFATAMIFPRNNYLSAPPAADEARLRSYFERNRLDFLPPTKEGEDEETNQTALPEIKFEDHADEVRQKVAAQDLADAQKEADRLAQKDALEFLDKLNSFSDRIKKNHSDFMSLRNSSEFKNFLKESGADQKKISFSAREMSVQSMVLGLERRPSEQRLNNEPLMEVEALSDTKFFTRSVRKSRNGHIVFILDRKIEERPAKFGDIPFSTLCQEYINGLRNDLFDAKVNMIKDNLLSGKSTPDSSLEKFIFEAKNQNTARVSFDTRQRTLSAKIERLEDKRSKLDKSEMKSLAALDTKKAKLQEEASQLSKERAAVSVLLERAEALNADHEWVELERNEGRAIFGLLKTVYSIRGKQWEEDQKNTADRNLELSRGMLSRDETLKELFSASFVEEE